jgi:hypothetical protein
MVSRSAPQRFLLGVMTLAASAFTLSGQSW